MSSILKKKVNYNYNTTINSKKSNEQSSKTNNYISETSTMFPSWKEWSNSAYFYDKNYIKLLVYKNNLVNYLFKSYFNLTRKILNEKRFRFNSKRFTSNRIFLSNAEIKHTNNNVNITLFVLNKNKNFIKDKLIKFQTKLYKLDKLKWNRMRNRWVKLFIFNTKTFKYSIYSQIKIFTKYMKKNILVKTNILYNLSKQDNIYIYTLHSLLNKIKNEIITKEKKDNNWRFFFYEKIQKRKKLVKKMFTNSSLYSASFNKYKYLKRNRPVLLNKQMFKIYKFLYYYQTLLMNRNKFANWFLNYKGLGLVNIISKLYNNKTIKFNIVNLKSMHLNSDIYSQAISLKLKNRNNKLLRVLKKSLLKIKLPWLFDLCNFNKNIFISNKKHILNSIRYKLISGVRFETSGRLSRRLVASRSIFKFKYVGSLKNIYSSYIGLSSVMLRGYLKSNIQYTMINSKTRNGAFGLKGWTSSY
jgi:hypothetical protein